MPVAKAARCVIFAGVMALTAPTPASAWSLFDLFQPPAAQSVQKTKKSRHREPELPHFKGPAPSDASCVRSSWYGGGAKRYEPNSSTASGARFDPWGMTVAHRTYAFGTKLLLTHGDRQVVATVTDRGPASWTGRSLDVSKGVAERLGFIKQGTACLAVSHVYGR